MMEDDDENDLLNRAAVYIKKDWLIIAVCLLTILICGVFYMNTAIIVAKCNDNCIKQFNDKCWMQEDVIAPNYNTSERFPVMNLSNWRMTEDENKADCIDPQETGKEIC